MNKLDLIKALAEEHQLSKADASRYVEFFFGSMADALSNGDRVEIRGLCSFKIKSYKSYTGRNPKTGEMVTVEEKRLPFFKAGDELKNRMNRNGQ